MLGRDMTNQKPRDFINLGVAHIPERRREMGIVEPMLVAEMLYLKTNDSDLFFISPFYTKNQFIFIQKI